jgi:hypothetical protein
MRTRTRKAHLGIVAIDRGRPIKATVEGSVLVFQPAGRGGLKKRVSVPILDFYVRAAGLLFPTPP